MKTLQGMSNNISVGPESRAAAAAGATALHDITEGGLLGALYEMAASSGVGFCLDARSIPLHPLTQRLCEELQINPLRFISSGSLIIACPEATAMLQAMAAAGVSATCIGSFTEASRMVLRYLDRDEDIAPPVGDALWEALARLL